MSDPRITAFVIAGMSDAYGAIMSETDENTIANYNKVMSNPEWAKKGLFYYTDEPWGEGLNRVRDAYLHVTEILGTTDIRNMTPFGHSWYDQAKGIDSVEFIKDYINVWCPTSEAYHRQAEGGRWSPRQVVKMYGEYYERAEAFRERGDELWWYVCCSPEAPYANYFTFYQGVINRVLSWQQYFNNVEGVLYYGTGVHWNEITKHKFNIYNGDGVLQFPGDKFGFDGVPLESWRLFQIRDGFDDFDYLNIAEEIVGRDAVMEVVRKVSSGITFYTEDWRVLDAARDEIVKLILDGQE